MFFFLFFFVSKFFTQSINLLVKCFSQKRTCFHSVFQTLEMETTKTRPVIIDKTEEDFKLKARKVIGRVLFATNCCKVYKLQPSGMCTTEHVYITRSVHLFTTLVLFSPHCWLSSHHSLPLITKKVYGSRMIRDLYASR